MSILGLVYGFCWLKGESAENPKDTVEYSQLQEKFLETIKGDEDSEESESDSD